MKKNIFILLGHENKETLSGAFADEYERGAREAGHEVRRMNIGDMQFDPLLHKGYKVIQELEPDLKTFRENVRWAHHIVIVHPVWWSNVPAILKGLFDRVWLPGFAYKYHPNGIFWTRLLKGRSSRLIMGQNSPQLITDLLFGNYSKFIKTAVFRFSGIYPVRMTRFFRTEHASPEKINRWKHKIYALGKRGI